jgi:hypothetical protein
VNEVVTSDTLYLMQINSDNSSGSTVLSATTQNETQYPGNIIPDGNGGVLATWSVSVVQGTQPTYPYEAVDVSGGAVGAPYTLPFSPQSVDITKQPVLVLGESSVAFAKGRSNVLINGVSTTVDQIASFNISSGAPNWTYQSTQQSTLSILAVLSDGSLAINDSQNGIFQLGTDGNSQITNSLGGVPQYSWSGDWHFESSQGAAALTLPLTVDPSDPWATPEGNSAQNGGADSLCPCLLQSIDNPNSTQPASRGPSTIGLPDETNALQTSNAVGSPPADCPFCTLASPQCSTPMSGSQSTYLIIIGDEGKNNGPGHNWDMGYTFPLAAQQNANDLNAQGHRVIACRATTVQDFNQALTSNGLIDGGVIYFGHSGRYKDPSSGIQYSALFVGQDPIQNENLYADNVNMLSGAQLGNNAAVWLNGCDGASDAQGGSSIAQLLSNQLQRGVYAYDVGVYFSKYTAANDPYIRGDGRKAPGDLPVYPVPEGAQPKPGYQPFTPFVVH